MSKELITVLGSTGSIGQSTLDVIRQHRDKYSVYALVAGSNVEQMKSDIVEFAPRYVVMANREAAAELMSSTGSSISISSGVEAMEKVASATEVSMVMAAIVGAAGLLPSLAAARAGKKVLLANKESLVIAGALFMNAVKENGATVLPIDSEHNAIYQCLPKGQYDRAKGVKKILLTGSGGPFRSLPLDELEKVTPEQAIKHPNWSMGPKISVDSATMMNKGLELIEACWLFDVSPSDVQIILHPQSIIHSMVQYIDGSVIAQMGNPDMRTPIAYGMSWPERIDSGVEDLDFFAVNQLNFLKPDIRRYPALRLAAEAFSRGGIMPAVLNAANEVAVAAFLAGEIQFTDIAELVELTMKSVDFAAVESIDQLLDVDARARKVTFELINQKE